MVHFNPRAFPNREKAERLAHDLSIFGRAYFYDMDFVKKISHNPAIRKATNSKLLSITNNRRNRETVFSLHLDTTLMPKICDGAVHYHFKRIKQL